MGIITYCTITGKYFQVILVTGEFNVSLLRKFNIKYLHVANSKNFIVQTLNINLGYIFLSSKLKT